MNPLAADPMSAWFDLCHRAGVRLSAAARMGEQLVAMYGEPQRRYHTLRHVQACLRWLGDTPLRPDQRIRVELALWFHDAVYDPTRADNEARSAALAEAWLRAESQVDADAVGELIRMTAGHEVGPDADLPTQVVHDVDLAILGAPPDQYREYAAQIRQEYGWLGDREYAAGRAGVLSAFLSLDRVYTLPSFAAVLEVQARQNLADELRDLAA